MEILFVRNTRRDYSRETVMWGDVRVRYTRVGCEDVVRPDPAGGFRVDQLALEEFVEKMRHAEVLMCDARTALLVRFIVGGRGLRAVPLIVLDGDGSRGLAEMAKWLAGVYGGNPLEILGDDTAIKWFSFGVGGGGLSGICGGRLWRLPIHPYFLMPSQMDRVVFDDKAAHCAKGNSVFCGGSANRDWAALVVAFDGLDVKLVVAGGNIAYWDESGGDVLYAEDATDARGTSLLYTSAIAVTPVAAGMCGGLKTIARAMAAGKPVVATRTVFLRELFDDGIEGFWVKEGNPADLREKTLGLLRDTVMREQMGLAAKKRAAALAEMTSEIFMDAVAGMM